MSKHITLKLTRDQAKELPWIIQGYIRLDKIDQAKNFGLTETDELHYSFVGRIKTTIIKQLADAKNQDNR